MLPNVSSSGNSLKETLNYIREDEEMPSVVSNHTVIDVSSHASRRKEEIVKACERIYSPILKSMKFFGMYFGDTRMEKFKEVASMPNRTFPFPLLRCVVAMTCLWLNVIMVFVSLCTEGISNPFFFFVLMGTLLCGLKTALIAIIGLAVFPVLKGKTTRFERFLQNLVETGNDLAKLKSCSIKGLIVAGTAWTSMIIMLIIASLYFPWSLVGDHKPWNDWYGFNLASLVIISIFVPCAWLLPMVFICVTCVVLEQLFDEFSKRVLNNSVPPWQLDLEAMKTEHRRLCETSDLASKMLSPFFLVFVTADIPLTCFSFYVSVNRPQAIHGDISELTYMLEALYWLLLSSVTVAVILVFASRVNGKVSDFTITSSV